MDKKIKIAIDSVTDNAVRVRMYSENNRTTLNLNVDDLKAILGIDVINQRRSYILDLKNVEDFKTIWSGTFDKNFKFKGDKEIKDTTKEDLKEMEKRLKKLRHYR